MRRQIEFATPAGLLVALRDEPYGLRHMALAGHPLYGPGLEMAADKCRALGMDVHDLPDRLYVTAGACDVERSWRRARLHTRARYEELHATSSPSSPPKGRRANRSGVALRQRRTTRRWPRTSPTSCSDRVPRPGAIGRVTPRHGRF